VSILFVAFPFSIHTARWLSQLRGTGWEVHLFSSVNNYRLHPEISGITYHVNFFDVPGEINTANRYRSPQFNGIQFLNSPLLKKIIRKVITIIGWRKTKADQLRKLIFFIKPDIIHSMETQHAGYILKEVQKKYSREFPFWIHSNWGIDLHFYGKLASHVMPIRETLSAIDVLIVEGNRDAVLARQYGFKGVLKTFPCGGGGFKIPDLPVSQTSTRKKILVKGTQDMVRRGLVALRALERCADCLADFEIYLYSSNEITQAAAELFYSQTGKKINILNEISHNEMLVLNKEARINICINKSDGLPNSMLEAMMMGTFPIQSNTSIAEEWITHGQTGMLVPAEDPEMIERAIREALTNDALVDNAAPVNRARIIESLNYDKIRMATVALYNEAYNSQPLKP